MSYLLDTNACIALINGKPPAVRARFQRVLGGGGEAYTSTIVAFELWYGVARSARQEANAQRVQTFFAGPVSLLPFEEEDARTAGRVRAELESVGKPIGAFDVLIAGQAMGRKLTLVTTNAREFHRIKGLLWEDWARS